MSSLFRAELLRTATVRIKRQIQKSDTKILSEKTVSKWIQNSMCSGKIVQRGGKGMDKHSYPPGASICQCVGQCACMNSVFMCNFKAGRMKGGSPVTLSTSVIPVSYMQWVQTAAHRCTDPQPHATKSPATALSACQQLHSPRSPGWVCVTPLLYPRISTGRLGTRSSSSLLVLPGEWQESHYEEEEGMEEKR